MTVFDQIWESIGATESDSFSSCGLAQLFLKRLERLVLDPLDAIGEERTCDHITQAKYVLQEEWQVWRKRPVCLHMKRTVNRNVLGCLDMVYFDCYDRLYLMEITCEPSRNIIREYARLVAPPAEMVANVTYEGTDIGKALIKEDIFHGRGRR
jgi:hypothetical protein